MSEHQRVQDSSAHVHERECDRRQADELEQQVAKLAVGVIGLRGALESVGTILRHDVEALRTEIDTQRALGKYNRRTHFQVNYWVALFAVHVSGLALWFADVAPWLFAFVFWLVPVEGGAFWTWRIAGALLQSIGLAIFWHRAQVPEHLFGRVAAGAEGRRSLYNRFLGRVS